MTPTISVAGVVAEQLEQPRARRGRSRPAGRRATASTPSSVVGSPRSPRSARSSCPARARRCAAGRSVGDSRADRVERGLVRRRRRRLRGRARAAGRRAPGQRRRAASRSALARGLLVDVQRSRRRAAPRRPAAGTPPRRRRPLGRARRRRRSASSRRSGRRAAAVPSPTVSWMSRAVPSPPAKSIRSTPRARSSRPPRARVGGARRRARRSRAGSTPPSQALRARRRRRPSRPARPGPHVAATQREPRQRPLGALGRDRRAPRARARRARRGPSVPFSADAPAHAGDRVDDQPERGASASPRCAARRRPRPRPRARPATISSISASVITNGGENEIESAPGSARVMTPRSRHAAVDARRDLAGRVELASAGRGRRRTRRAPTSAVAADLADERVIGERLLERACMQRAALPRPGRRARRSRSRRGSPSPPRRRADATCTCSRGRRRRRRAASTSTRHTFSETMQAESGT